VDYIQAMMPRFNVNRSFKYGPKGAQIESPDVLVTDDGKMAIVAECKATKLTYLAQFAEDPFDAEKKQYDQLARGVLQLWRYFSHIRRGIVKEKLTAEAYAMVLTLDTFLTLNHELLANVLKEANNRADKEQGILTEDRRPVVFCSIQDLESILSIATEDTFLAALKAAQDEKFLGWRLREIHRDTAAEKDREQKKYPFTLDKVLPWWGRKPAVDAPA
jgi:hypothetical protein